jgi:DNA-binding transcriptional LysR family regulator
LSAQNGQLMLKSDKPEFERGAAAKTENQDRYHGKENRHHGDGTAGSRKSPASLCPVEILSKDTRGLAMPKASLVTLSMSVITHFLADGQFITAMPRSVVYFKSLKVLPVDLPMRPWPVNIVTLKNRMLSPAAEQFIACARDFTRPMREGQSVAKR